MFCSCWKFGQSLRRGSLGNSGEISGRHSAELPHLHFSSQHRRTLKGRKSLLWAPFLGLWTSVKLDNLSETSLRTQRHRQWKRAVPSLTPCKGEAPNSTLTDLWSHFKLLNLGDVIIIRLHNLKALPIVPYLEAPISVIAVFPTFPVYSCYWTTLHFFFLL